MRKTLLLVMLANTFRDSFQTREEIFVRFFSQLKEESRSDLVILQSEALTTGLTSMLVQNCSATIFAKVSDQNFKIYSGKRALIHVFHVQQAEFYLHRARINRACGRTHTFVMVGSEAHESHKDHFRDVQKLIWLESIRDGKLMIKQLKCNKWSDTHIWTPRQTTELKEIDNLFPRFQFCTRPLFSIPVFAVAANNLFMLNNPLTKTVDFHGYEKNMVEEIGRDMGFQVRLTYSELGAINGTSALGLVNSGKAEMTMGFLSLTLLRSKHFAFSYPHEDTVIGMFMQRPNSLKKWLAIAWPLDILTWLAIIASVLLFTLAFWLWLGPRSTPILSAFGVVLSFILKKGLTGYHLNGRIRRHKTRLFLLGWIAAIVFLKIWYKSTLRAVLISPWQHAQPQTFEDVLEMKPDVYVFGSGAADQFISNLDSPIFKELRNSPGYKRILFQELGQTIQLIQNDASSFLVNGILSNYKQTMNQVFNAQNVVKKIYSYESQTGLSVLKQTIRIGYNGFLVRNNAPYLDRMNELIIRMLSHGLIKKWNSDAEEAIKWNNHLLVSYGVAEMADFPEEPKWRVISMDMLLGVFLFQGVSWALGLIILLYELGYCGVCSQV